MSPFSAKNNKFEMFWSKRFRSISQAREVLLEGKVQYSWSPSYDCFVKKKDILVQGGQLYWSFPFRKDSLVRSTARRCYVEKRAFIAFLGFSCWLYWAVSDTLFWDSTFGLVWIMFGSDCIDSNGLHTSPVIHPPLSQQKAPWLSLWYSIKSSLACLFHWDQVCQIMTFPN
jgi:hypothetical protein